MQMQTKFRLADSKMQPEEKKVKNCPLEREGKVVHICPSGSWNLLKNSKCGTDKQKNTVTSEIE